MNEIKVIGSWGHGLKAFYNNELYYYSKVNSTWFKGDFISILDSEDNLVLKINELGFWRRKTKLIFQNNDFIELISFKEDSFLKQSLILLNSNDKITFKSPVFGYPVFATILINKELFCKLKMKFGWGKHLTATAIFETDKVKYVLILILIIFTSYDHDSDND